jgi:hypothetical protein
MTSSALYDEMFAVEGGFNMQRLIVGLVFFALPALAERHPTPAQQAQQDRMRVCNASAHSQEMRGTQRRNFMKECLAGRGATSSPSNETATSTAPR